MIDTRPGTSRGKGEAHHREGAWETVVVMMRIFLCSSCPRSVAAKQFLALGPKRNARRLRARRSEI